MASSLLLLVDRSEIGPVATMSSCRLYRSSDKARTKLFDYPGIENSLKRIRPGTYSAKWTRSPRFSKQATEKAREADPNAPEVDVFTYEIFGVMSDTGLRAGIRIHPVNFARDLLGCLAFGIGVADIDKDGIMDLTRSREAQRIFNEAAKQQDLVVVITDPVILPA